MAGEWKRGEFNRAVGGAFYGTSAAKPTNGYVMEGLFGTYRDSGGWPLIHLRTGLQIWRCGSRADAGALATRLLLAVECDVGSWGNAPKSAKGRRFVRVARRIVVELEAAAGGEE